jgi:hypothetical protein
MAWLATRLSDAAATEVTSVDVTAPVRAGVGQSSETWLFQAAWADRGHRRTADLVLRMQPGYDGIFLLPPDTRMGHGNSLTQALARRLGLPVPELSEDYLLHRSGRLGRDAVRSTSRAG